MKKPVSIYSVKTEPIPNREGYYHLRFRAGNGEVDAVFERSSLRHIIEQIDNGISTGL